MKLANGYAYNARHGEYLPNGIAEEFSDYEESDEPLPVPAWVTPELIADGFGDGPRMECYIRVECDETGLFARVRALFDSMVGGPFGADDDSFDYWPSGALLFCAMCADLAEPDHVRAAAAMRQQLIEGISRYEPGDEVHDRIMEILG